MATNRAAKYNAHFSSKQELRLVFTSLNGDNSWLLSFPRPVTERESTGKAYLRIVHDPGSMGLTSNSRRGWSTSLYHPRQPSATKQALKASCSKLNRQRQKQASFRLFRLTRREEGVHGRRGAEWEVFCASADGVLSEAARVLVVLGGHCIESVGGVIRVDCRSVDSFCNV
ncbi:hypothetical protein BU25DRAFT_419203 [Macroventuria anomochaeta]|uniref:Uncharacterized protein n=1 Tax=Macroventuria anomochaeta TaxID=301207 RepID=A0ACB6S9J5_9PLEO|nr:uncharacterized protein BU25DRAFT_419203 [Macroventuria anomochaeta]KAF2630886.1 hypothetical protein BU25DRAFT_419203 [Macroventuria anomochaeta]